MIQPLHFLERLQHAGISFFTGVPDSLLKGFISAVEATCKPQHTIAANEGAAIGLAAGYHLATGKIPLVYLQNSGLGNTVNPLTSLCDKEMYGIPMLLIVGWRGEPGVKDEPQHSVMGKITPSLLNLVHVPFIVLKKDDAEAWMQSMDEAIQRCKQENRPVALLVEAEVFAESDVVQSASNDYELGVEEAIEIIYRQLLPTDIVLCTTGKIGRTFYAINEQEKKVSRYFLNVGSMGHAISIATGISMHQGNRVILFDGDGSLLMHMGALALPASLQLPNFLYVLLNNGAHQSVGAQPTLGFHVDFCGIAQSCGFTSVVRIEAADELEQLVTTTEMAGFVEVRINTHTNENLPRPLETPKEAKEIFMSALGSLPTPE